jgi:thioredoxin
LAREASVALTELTIENFKDAIDGNDIVVVDFWAPWCGPCKNFAPIFEEASERHTDVVFAKVNTEEHPDLASTFQIRSIPMLMIFREKVIVFSQAGVLPASALDDLLAQAQALDMDEVHREVGH